MILAQEYTKRRYWLAGHRHPAQDTFFKEALDPQMWEEGDAENWDSCWYTGMPDEAVFEQRLDTRSVEEFTAKSSYEFLSTCLFDAKRISRLAPACP